MAHPVLWPSVTTTGHWAKPQSDLVLEYEATVQTSHVLHAHQAFSCLVGSGGSNSVLSLSGFLFLVHSSAFPPLVLLNGGWNTSSYPLSQISWSLSVPLLETRDGQSILRNL